MKKQGISWLLGLVCVASLLGTAAAAPSAGGGTGNLMTPSADLMRQGQFHIGWQQEAGSHSLAAAVPVTNRFEISVLQRTQAGHSSLEAGFKYSLRGEGVLTPGIAIGAEDIAAEHRRSVYAVVTKTLPYGLRVHAGVGNGRYAGGFAALEVRLLPRAAVGRFPDVTAYAEHVDDHAAYGLRLALARGLKVSAGVDGHAHFVGLSYNFY